MTTIESLDTAKSIAKTASKATSSTVCIYQVGAAAFAVAYDNEAVPARGILIGQYKNGLSAAPVIAA